MKWYEYYSDAEGNAQYYKCDRCESFPAMALTFQDDHEHGPFCKKHWLEEVTGAFSQLYKKIDDEDWGSSPETNKECWELDKNEYQRPMSCKLCGYNYLKGCYGQVGIPILGCNSCKNIFKIPVHTSGMKYLWLVEQWVYKDGYCVER